MSILSSIKLLWSKQWLEQLKPGTSGQQLLAVHNGYCLWLGLVHFNGKNPELIATGASTAIDAVAAVSEAHQLLAQQYTERLPRQVTFISTCALPALLDLPIDPEKIRKMPEMTSMISWELENQVADNNDLYLLGAILVGRELITPSQRHETAVELEMRRSNGNGLTRYGEVAIDLGFITTDQLQESLLLQEKLAVTDAHLACGWQVQTLLSEDKTEHQWLTAGIDTKIRRQWFNAFAHNRLKLTHIIPLLGSAAPWAAMQSDNGNAVVVEAHQDSFAVYRLERSQIASFQLQPRQYNQPLTKQCYGVTVEQLRSDTEAVLLVDIARQLESSNNEEPTKNTPQEYLDTGTESTTPNTDSQPPQSDPGLESCNDLSDLSRRLQHEAQWLIPENTCRDHHLPDGVISAFYGAAVAAHKHALFSLEDSSVHLAQVPPREPPPPLWKNKGFYRYGIPIVLLLCLLAHGSYSLWQKGHLQGRLDALDSEYKERLALNKQLSSITGKYKQKEDELSDLQKQSDNTVTELNRLNHNVVHRTRMLPRLLKTISQSVMDSIMLDSITEPKRDGQDRFNVTAWAMDNASASQFTERLQQLVGRLNYRVTDPDIKSGIGRYGLNGYTIDLWLIPVKNPEATNANNTGRNSEQQRGISQ
jgi:cell division protein FtsB